ncbi:MULTISPECIES: hypothetical protein [Pandoraea]|uniref:hypothetical protein n=1 Tax=Pandoraea TaxID=93217 RepID=UPI0003D22B6D|nr:MULTISPECIES: hypothetical protein [Pandoraea]AHB78455.1 hypothetical protein X636_09620 [Pandoraea pnomenusa]
MRTRRYSIADLRLVCDYLRALRNEIAVDIRTIELSGLDPSRYGKLPRPSRWIAKVGRFAFLTRLAQYVIGPTWHFLGPWLFRHQCRAAREGRVAAHKVEFDAAGQVLAFSIRAQDIVRPQHVDPAPKQWIEMPWLPLSDLPSGAEVIPVMSLLDSAELDRSLFLATLAHRALWRRRGMSGWELQSFTAWRWFLMRLAVDKLPGPLLTVEHFDRWAVLADSSVRQSRYRRPTRRLTLVQHGSVNADSTPPGLGFHLPTRLNAVSHLRVYSAADAEIFKVQILSRHCTDRGLTLSFYSPRVSLTTMTAPGSAPSILFVGHPLCESAHCALLAALRKEGEWQVFYKPHPTAPASHRARELSWTVVDGRVVFPRVDLLISYPSTLVAEYATHGIPAVVHSMDVRVPEILERVPEIIHLLNSRYSGASVSHSCEPAVSLSNDDH